VKSPEVILALDSGALVVSCGDLGKILVQGGGFRQLSKVRFPDFPLPWEDDLAGSPNGSERVDTVSGVQDSFDLSGEEETLVLASTQTKSDWKSSPVKSLIKRGFFGPRAATPPSVVVDVLPDPACELIRWGGQFGQES
jgi:hypothetical protein